jgi:hypothetical protein
MGNVRILPTASTIPPFPVGGLKTLEQTERYLRQLSSALKQDRGSVGDRVERRVLYGQSTEKPTADGSGNLHWSEDTEELDIDTGTWDNIVTSGGISDHGDLTGLDDPDDHLWAVHVAGDTMTGDLVMDACEIYLGAGSGGIIFEYSAGNFANGMYTTSGNALNVGDTAITLLLYGYNERPYYTGFTGTPDYLALVADLAFLNLSDVDETDYTGHAGEPVVVNATADGLAFAGGSGGFVLKAGDTMTGPLRMTTAAYLLLEAGAQAPQSGAVNLGFMSSSGLLQISTVYGDISIGANFDYLCKIALGTGINGILVDKPFIIEQGGSLQIWDGVGSKYTVIQDDGGITGVNFGHSSLSCNLLGSDSRPTYNGYDLALYADIGGGASAYFTDLVDTPASYTGAHSKAVMVHATLNELEFIDLDDKYVNKITGGTFSGEVTFSSVGIIFLNDGSPYCNWLMEASDTTGALAIFDRSSGSTYPFAIDLGAANNSVRMNLFGIGILKAPILTGEALQVDGGIDIANNESLKGWNSTSTTLYDLIGVNTSNGIDLGDAGVRCNLLGLPTLRNDDYLYGRNYLNNAYVNIAKVNTSNHTELGDATSGRYTYLMGDRTYVDNTLYIDQTILHTSTSRNVFTYDSGVMRYGDAAGIMDLYSSGVVRFPGINLGLRFEYSAGNYGDFLNFNATSITFGSDLRDLWFRSGTNFTFITKDLRVQGGDILIYGTATFYDACVMDASNNMIFGDEGANSVSVVAGVLTFKGKKSSSSDPNTTSWPTASTWGIHKNTSSGAVFLVYNDGGTIKTASLA